MAARRESAITQPLTVYCQNPSNVVLAAPTIPPTEATCEV